MGSVGKPLYNSTWHWHLTSALFFLQNRLHGRFLQYVYWDFFQSISTRTTNRGTFTFKCTVHYCYLLSHLTYSPKEEKSKHHLAFYTVQNEWDIFSRDPDIHYLPLKEVAQLWMFFLEDKDEKLWDVTIRNVFNRASLQKFDWEIHKRGVNKYQSAWTEVRRPKYFCFLNRFGSQRPLMMSTTVVSSVINNIWLFSHSLFQ